MDKEELVVRALHTTQGAGLDVYAFFIRGGDIMKIADISRVERDEHDLLKGFQRPEIQQHVKEIVEYLDQGNVLFPNSLILAMSPEVRFTASRGTRPNGDAGVGQTGTLTIPVFEAGSRVAWIVDGQQRSLALSRSTNQLFPVPVVAFVSDSLEVQREQFVLVNKAKPLPRRLIDELLPETRNILLPRDLRKRKAPSELCNWLNRNSKSPFYNLIKRPSDKKDDSSAVITDTSVVEMIRQSLSNPLGALAPYKPTDTEPGDIDAMCTILVTYWSAVRDVFPEAWGKDPRQSRLMHSAGILAMGVLMDRIYARLSGVNESYASVRKEIEKVAPFCRWTSGVWESIGLRWNDIESTSQDKKRLQDALVRAYTNEARK
ncbi:DGQHR domain-containing protein DpdB [Telluria sp. Tellsp104]